MNERLKKIIYNKLFDDLKDAEIIPYEDYIWFIDREKKYWYLRYSKSGLLVWRWDFFNRFFQLFSMQQKDYQYVISSWVEYVLNYKVESTTYYNKIRLRGVEDVLNYKVKDFGYREIIWPQQIEKVLKCKVNIIDFSYAVFPTNIENVLEKK